MDFIHKIMNIIVPPIALIMLVSFLPTYLFFKLLLSTIKSRFMEDVAGKVILIAGASSGIGEVCTKTSLLFCMLLLFSFSHACIYTVVLKHLAYEYARRGACLALVARRENRLREVASTAYQLGSPEVIVIRADVSRVEDCERFVDETVQHFGRCKRNEYSSIFVPCTQLYYYYYFLILWG